MTLKLCNLSVKSLEKSLNSLTMTNVPSNVHLLIVSLCLVIVKASSGPRYVVGCRTTLDKSKLVQHARVSLDMTTLTIMRILPREVDPVVYNMSVEDPGSVSFAGIGGLSEQIRELREVYLLTTTTRNISYFRSLNCLSLTQNYSCVWE